MKKLYIFILFISTIGLFAQTQSEGQIIQTMQNGLVTYQKIPPKQSVKKAKTNNITSINTNFYLAEESFEGTFPPTPPYPAPPYPWRTHNVISSWSKTLNNQHSGTYSAFTPGDPQADTWLISPPIDLTGASAAYLHYYDYSIPEPGASEDFFVMISTDYDPNSDPDPTNATWDNLYSVIDNVYQWNTHHIEIDMSYIIGNQPIYIAFYYINYDEFANGSQWFIDDVSVSDFDGCGVQPVPVCATLVSPPNGATKMQKDVGLFWAPPNQDISKQFLYVGTDGGGVTTPINKINGVEFGEYTVGITVPDLAFNTTYYWQIIPTNCANEAQNCPIWSFTIGDGNTFFGGGGPTQGGYTFANSTSGASGAPAQPTYSWIDISGTGTDLISTIGEEETKGPYVIGFPFTFFGNTYTQFYINANGFITFENVTGQTNFPYPIPANNKPDDVIAGFWDNLYPNNPNISGKHLYYGLSGGDLVITFEKCSHSVWGGSGYVPSTNPNDWITFQIILKPNGNIKIQFQAQGNAFVSYNGGVGIENSDGTKGVLYRRLQYGSLLFGAGGASLAVEFYPNNVNASAQINIFLEGPYSTGSMSNSLSSSIPIAQPYSVSPWSYTGSETTELSFITTNNIVDWVYIELRSGASAGAATTVVSRRAALVKDTGVIIDTNGSTDIDFGGVLPGDYYIAVFHRNHLPIISSQPITFSEIGVGF